MWIISFLPEWVFHLIFGVGILATVAGFIIGVLPALKQYKLAIQVVGVLILTLGVYLEGGLADYKEWEARVKELEAKAAVAEEKAKTANAQLEGKIADANKDAKQKGDTIIKYVNKYRDREVLKEIPGPERVRVEEVIKYVENCPVPKELLDLHNKAATLKPNETKPSEASK